MSHPRKNLLQVNFSSGMTRMWDSNGADFIFRGKIMHQQKKFEHFNLLI